LLELTLVLAFVLASLGEPDEQAFNPIIKKQISVIAPRADAFERSRCCFVITLFIVLLFFFQLRTPIAFHPTEQPSLCAAALHNPPPSRPCKGE